MSDPIKYEGFYSYDGEESRTKRFLFYKPHKIAFDFTSEGYEYSVELYSDDGIVFKGDYHITSENDVGLVTGSIVTLTEHNLYITGDWHESGDKGKWHARLSPVAHFADETDLNPSGANSLNQ